MALSVRCTAAAISPYAALVLGPGWPWSPGFMEIPYCSRNSSDTASWTSSFPALKSTPSGISDIDLPTLRLCADCVARVFHMFTISSTASSSFSEGTMERTDLMQSPAIFCRVTGLA
eukprot:CAMPEP_0181528638 /NCGR_PEP_ID=MMETSP1110-20121109/70641_1 /TAXON_ID=174948 /ORGANISM="Symbiodinium sp., Strain CCMP421" /LENGTH=116 /DNA_ID=CAMNT_0023659589 /DNA_START=157 /DNA_END=504 /DNA_ORIENTATION=-